MEQKCHVQVSVNIGFIGAGNMAKALGEGMINAGSEAASR
jgi:pyrroline-5-carboxylate reductase